MHKEENVHLLLIFLAIVISFFAGVVIGNENRLNKNDILTIRNKVSITADEAAKLLNLSTEDFNRLVEIQKGLKEEGLGRSFEKDTFLEWHYLDGEMRFNPKQVENWMYNLTTREEPLFRE